MFWNLILLLSTAWPHIAAVSPILSEGKSDLASIKPTTVRLLLALISSSFSSTAASTSSVESASIWCSLAMLTASRSLESTSSDLMVGLPVAPTIGLVLGSPFTSKGF